ncbi:MAG: hypothetical protein QXX79_04975, partial [Candidatus Bathyarchaeia archaeon]
RPSPEGLYEDQRFWMYSRDLEGVGVHFSYGFIKKAGACHPVREGASLVHPYDEVLMFGPCDPSDDILHLGAEIAIEVGEENEELVFDEPAFVVIPKGTPHGPVTVRNLSKPIAHYLVGLGPEYKAEFTPKKTKTTGTKHIGLIKKFRGVRSLVSKKLSVGKPRPTFLGPGHGDLWQAAWAFGEDLGLDINLEWAFYSGSGLWHRIGRGGAHVHPTDELLIFVGLDPENLNNLGAEVEAAIGEEDERHAFSKPTVVIAPKNVIHCPFITRWVDKPYGFIVFCLDRDHTTTWLPPEE